ncbi:AraC family transcriptional regulator of adaptative response / DNA-3-methyladenine glycosylase II [Catenuloplanes nepalensis]|uniref:DNA-3-methyladenine glycosylase II n=1 Tax=Catenuloplanes nepalensis TaxID=587533 RepID=A0ABT9N201_9ACTN|nr:AraC family transcriptional regulator of adaptative response / DNA-3-methyladenine glycosylase II [Catenuloplanes nepalensis]
MELDFERCYRAVDSRDQRFDGWFFTAVTSTGIYCRPSCPAVTPRRENVRFYPSAAAAQGNGFRACRRCRPDAAPGSPEWDSRADAVGRAMRLIGDGVVDREGVPGLARRLGYTERHLQRLLTAEVGAGPLALARAQRAQTARILIETTGLSLTEIAFAAGFGSVRQFNETMQAVFDASPSQLRESRRQRSVWAVPGPAEPAGPGVVHLRLSHRAPLHVPALLGFLAARAIPGVEEASAVTYRRALSLPNGPATAELTPRAGYVAATLRVADMRDLAPAVARCRRLLDLDADPDAIDGLLDADPYLSPSVSDEPGVRVPRAVDGFEMAVRAVVGQQISVASARSVLKRLVRAAAALPSHDTASVAAHDTAAGEPAADVVAAEDVAAEDVAAEDVAAEDVAAGRPVPGYSMADDPAGLMPFPSAERLLALPDDAFGMPVARRETLRALARAVADGLVLDPGGDREEITARLTALPGIGAWTAGYVALRALGDPDVLLPTDLAVRKGARALGLPHTPAALAARAEQWRPWRSYALIRLWRAAAAASGPATSATAATTTSATAASSPAAFGPPASGPSASAVATSGPAATGPPASGPSASAVATSGPAATGRRASGRATSGPAASATAISGPSASGPAATTAGVSTTAAGAATRAAARP